MEAFIPRGKKLADEQAYSKREKIDALIHPGRQTNPRKGYQSATQWITDLIALRKTVILCDFCRVKFNPRFYKYRRIFIPDVSGKTDGYTVNGQCDACKGETAQLGGGTGYYPEEEYDKVYLDPSEVRRNARATAKSLGTWQFLKSQRR